MAIQEVFVIEACEFNEGILIQYTRVVSDSEKAESVFKEVVQSVVNDYDIDIDVSDIDDNWEDILDDGIFEAGDYQVTLNSYIVE